MRGGPGGVSPQACLPLMPRLKQALEHSRRIADALDTRLADTEHLLAGTVAVPDSMAVEMLRRLGVSPGPRQRRAGGADGRRPRPAGREAPSTPAAAGPESLITAGRVPMRVPT